MEQSPSWVANSYSPSQEIPGVLRNLMAHYRVHKSLPTVPIVKQMNPAHTFPLYFPKIHPLILSCHLHIGLLSGLFPSGLPTKPFSHFLSPMRATCPIHLILLQNEQDVC
jgi:hypothetical protein